MTENQAPRVLFTSALDSDATNLDLPHLRLFFQFTCILQTSSSLPKITMEQFIFSLSFSSLPYLFKNWFMSYSCHIYVYKGQFSLLSVNSDWLVCILMGLSCLVIFYFLLGWCFAFRCSLIDRWVWVHHYRNL